MRHPLDRALERHPDLPPGCLPRDLAAAVPPVDPFEYDEADDDDEPASRVSGPKPER